MRTHAHVFPSNAQARAAFYTLGPYAVQLGGSLDVVDARITVGGNVIWFYGLAADLDLRRMHACEFETLTNHGAEERLVQHLRCRVRPQKEKLNA